MNPPPHLSVVIPLYQAAGCVAPLCDRLSRSLSELDSEHEIIFVDDASQDASWDNVKQAAANNPHIKGIRLSRNFGQHYAITAGLGLSQGAWTAVMDCDLQDAPEDIRKLYQKAQEGFDIVYARQHKVFGSLSQRLFSWIYHAIIRFSTGGTADGSMGSFSILSRPVVDAFLQVRDAQRHYAVILRWLGFRRTFIDVDRHARASGETSYTFSKLLSLAVDGLIAQSNVILKIAIYMGFVTSFAALACMARVVWIKLMHPGVPVGYASLMATLLLLGGLILMSLGVLGIYIDRLLHQTKQRPLFVIQERFRL